MRRLILGTAGHIDHGKTTLVRALTGIDTDRLPEEKRRGITIDIGFASLTLPNDVALGIVDVPGHEAFVRNMLAGTTGIDMVLLVIAADEGVMPQTREHLAIVDLLGIRRGVVALTKIDAVEPEWLELVRDEVRETLLPTALDGCDIVAVSATTGVGLPELVAALADVAHGIPGRTGDDLFRMPIDRVFTVRGTGTVVTGTVWSGTLRRDAQVTVLPAGVTARVRALQQHGAECEEIGAGARAAVALAGVDRQDIARGETLVQGSAWAPHSILTVHLTALTAAPPLRQRQRVRVHLGTAEAMARLALYDGAVEPGATALAQLRLEQPLVARAGDRFVIRSYSPVHTIGGGVVLEPFAPKRKRISAAERAVLALLREPAPGPLCAVAQLVGAAGVPLDQLPIRTGLPQSTLGKLEVPDDAILLVQDRAVAAAHLKELEAALLRHVDEYHRAHPMAEGIERESLRRMTSHAPLFDVGVDRLVRRGALRAAGSALALTTHAPAATGPAVPALTRLTELYRSAGLEPPDIGDLPRDLAPGLEVSQLLQFLERNGTLVRLTPTRWMDAGASADAATRLRTQLPAGVELGVADFKEILGLTRKHLIPLLEHFDRTGVTVRRGESRVLVAAYSGAPAPAPSA